MAVGVGVMALGVVVAAVVVVGASESTGPSRATRRIPHANLVELEFTDQSDFRNQKEFQTHVK